MMGPTQETKPKLFHYGISIESRVRTNNPLRRIQETMDFEFVREAVKDKYGKKGHKSEDPIVIMKLMLLLFFDDVPSERELMRMVAERLDYMWFLGFDLDEEIPDHSVLSKARRRWGPEVFEELFVESVGRCMAKGLVEGSKLHMDGTLINGNASKDSVKRGPVELIEQLRQAYRAQETKLDESGTNQTKGEKDSSSFDNSGDGDATRNSTPQTEVSVSGAVTGEDSEPAEIGTNPPSICSRNKVPVRRAAVRPEAALSTTDIDTAVVRKGAGDGARPRYKNHRAVDDQCGVITAMTTTPGDVSENTMLMELVQQHEQNTGRVVGTVVADAQYGTNDNFAACEQRGIRSHMADLRSTYTHDASLAVFGEDQFQYDAEKDAYRCPAGQSLTRKREDRGYEVYGLSKRICNVCALRNQCTRSKNGRTLKRHRHHDLVEKARIRSHSHAARQDRKRRRHLMEGSFADGANNHGLKRARWRRLVHQAEQDYLIAVCQNIRTLMRYGYRPAPAVSMAAVVVKPAEIAITVAAYMPESVPIEASKRPRMRSLGPPLGLFWRPGAVF
jgi:transposase